MKLLGLEFNIGHQFYPSMYVIVVEDNEGSFMLVPVLGLFGIGFLTFMITLNILRVLS